MKLRIERGMRNKNPFIEFYIDNIKVHRYKASRLLTGTTGESRSGVLSSMPDKSAIRFDHGQESQFFTFEPVSFLTDRSDVLRAVVWSRVRMVRKWVRELDRHESIGMTFPDLEEQHAL